MPPETPVTDQLPPTSLQNDPPPPDAAPVVAAPVVQPPPPQNPKRNVMHSPNAIKAIKDEERAKAERNFQRRLDDEARQLGFKSHDDMKQAAADRRQQRQDPPPPQQQPTQQQPRTNARTDNRIAQLAEDRRKANKRAAQTEKRNRDLERDLAAKEVEWELKLIAVRQGVRDVDYAVTLIQRHTANMSPEELNAFDEEKYFRDDLRKERPYLYGEEVRPANTDPTQPPAGAAPNGGAPPPPKKAPPPATSEVVDAKSMTREQFEAHLRSQGLGNSLTLARPS